MRLEDGWGRFTERGDAAVEAEVTRLVRRAGELVRASVPPDAYRALIMLGGYGRGEGGVERRGGVLRPHNNLDFLLITTLRGSAGRAASKRRLDEILRPLVAESGVGIDTGVINAWRLRAAPCLVRWFDLRLGHKTVLGDPSFVASLPRFEREAIEPSDVRDLLVNRGTLLVINDLLVARGARGLADRRTLIKHAMKAIIGYGDACLFARGDYSYSYAEKQRRMRARGDVPPAFRALYDEAMEFRFEPSYERYLDRDPRAWMRRLREDLAPIHLSFEAFRLGDPGLGWEGYADRALSSAFVEAPLSPRALVRKGRNLLFRGRARPSAPADRGGLAEELALGCCGPKGRLAVAFPAVLYGAGGPRGAELARRALGAGDASPVELRRAYLAAWRAAGDTNFSSLVEQLALPLDPARGAGVSLSRSEP